MNDKKDLYALLHHFRNCPAEFLNLDPLAGDTQQIIALISDLFRTVYGDFSVRNDELPSLNDFHTRAYTENELRSIYLAIWFFHYPIFGSQPALLEPIKHFLLTRLPALCQYVVHQQWLDDEDRAEEFVREALQACDILSDGETMDEAQDRLDALSTLKRQRVLEGTNESMLRMKAIRQAMAHKKAREAANVYGRE